MPILVSAPPTNPSWNIKVEIAFVADPYSSSLTWSDVSADVVAFSCKRGRNYYLATMEAGTASLTLWNRDGRYSPDNAGGSHAGTVLPRRPIRISGMAGGTTFRLWRGFIDTLTQSWSDDDNFTQLAITAVDAFQPILSAEFGPRYVDVLTDDLALASGLGWYAPNYFAPTATSNKFTGTGNAGFSAIHPTNAPVVTLMPGSLASAADSTGYTRLSATFGQGIGTNFVDSNSFNPSNLYSAEIRFRIHAPDSHGTHPTLGVMYPNSTHLIYLVHSGTAGSGYALVFGSTTSSAQTLISTWGDLALDQVISLAIVRQSSSAGGYRIYVNGVLWYDGTADTSGSAMGGNLFESVPGASTFVSTGFQVDVDQVAFYTVAPSIPVSPGRLTDSMVLTHYNLSGLSGLPVPDFPQQTTGQRINAVLDMIGWPAADRLIDTGNTIMAASGSVQGRTALDLILEAAQSELGEAFVDGSGRLVFHSRHHRDGAVPAATFGDAAGETNYTKDVQLILDQTRIINYVQVAQSIAGTPQTAIRVDQTSLNVYKTKTLALSLPLANATDCDGMATTLLATYKDPHLRVEGLEFDFISDKTLARMIAVLGREIGDLVTYNRRPIAGYSTSITNRVEGLSFTYQGYPLAFTAALNLEPAAPTATY